MEDTKPKPFAFVLMPFDESFGDIYEIGIKTACREAGAYCERVESRYLIWLWWHLPKFWQWAGRGMMLFNPTVLRLAICREFTPPSQTDGRAFGSTSHIVRWKRSA